MMMMTMMMMMICVSVSVSLSISVCVCMQLVAFFFIQTHWRGSLGSVSVATGGCK